MQIQHEYDISTGRTAPRGLTAARQSVAKGATFGGNALSPPDPAPDGCRFIQI